MSSDEIVINVKNLSKRYEIYATPRDRLKQLVFPSIYTIFEQIIGLFGRASDRTAPQYFREFWALHDVSFQVKKGETLGIVGRNGSGKSTLLQLICSTLSPTSGDVTVNGRISALLELGSGFNPEYTGRENVFLNGQILGLSQKEIESRFEAIAEFADIGDFIDQPVKTYSSGMAVRLAFAVASNVDPEILVIDEALAVGDVIFQFKCRKRMEELIDKGTTLLFVSHDMNSVKSFCNRAIYLEHGQKKAEGTPEEIVENYFMDARAEQLQNQHIQAERAIPKVIGKDIGGFGTADGDILYARFVTNQRQHSIFNYQGIIEFEVACKVSSQVKYPSLSVIVQTPKLLALGGKWVSLNNIDPAKDGVEIVRLRFPAKLNEGKYFVTLRLEERAGKDIMFPLHKIPGALVFDIVKSDDSLLGFMDLQIDHEFSTDAARINE